MKIAFIGLGIMGSRMATNLAKSGVDITVYNRSEEPSKKLEEIGATRKESLKEALEESDIVFTMLSNPEVVTELMLEEGLRYMKHQSLWVDCSTVNPSFTKVAFSRAKNLNINYLEAPVAGTKPQAESGELTFFVGGEQRHLERARPFLEIMGGKTLHLGEVGKGASFKMLVNMMLGLGMLAFAESLKLGEAMGLDKEMLLNTIPNLPVSPAFTKMKAELIRDGDFETQFPLELLHKDLHLASISAYESNQSLPLTNLAKEMYHLATSGGMGREDMAAIYKFLK